MTSTQRFGQPQVGDLYVSDSQGRIHILVAYEFVYKDRIDFYKYYKSTLRRLDDGAITSWTKPQHEFYAKYKPLKPDPKHQAVKKCPTHLTNQSI